MYVYIFIYIYIYIYIYLYIYIYISANNFPLGFMVHFNQLKPVPRLVASIYLNPSAGSAVITSCCIHISVYLDYCAFVSRCNNLNTYTLVDILYQFHTSMCSHLFVFCISLFGSISKCTFLARCNSGSISICIHVYLHLNVDLFPPRLRAEATGRGRIVSRCNNFHACPLHDVMYSCFIQI